MPQFNFQFGNKRPDKKQIIVLSIVVSSIIAALSQCTGISDDKWWDLIDEISRKYPSVLKELILLDTKKVERRVERDVDKAVDDYWKQTGYKKAEVYKPRYIEEENNESLCYTDECKSLAPPMRLCAPWLDNCPKQ